MSLSSPIAERAPARRERDEPAAARQLRNVFVLLAVMCFVAMVGYASGTMPMVAVSVAVSLVLVGRVFSLSPPAASKRHG